MFGSTETQSLLGVKSVAYKRILVYFEQNSVIAITFVFTKLPWSGNSERTFWFSGQAATSPPVYHTRQRLHNVPLIAERQAEKL